MHVPHASNFYGKFEILNFHIFWTKRLFQIKSAITIAYGLEKKHIIYEKPSTQKVISDFNGKYESRKILDFVKKNKKFVFFEIYFIISSTF
jgi:hypothetical protein